MFNYSEIVNKCAVALTDNEFFKLEGVCAYVAANTDSVYMIINEFTQEITVTLDLEAACKVAANICFDNGLCAFIAPVDDSIFDDDFIEE